MQYKDFPTELLQQRHNFLHFIMKHNVHKTAL